MVIFPPNVVPVTEEKGAGDIHSIVMGWIFSGYAAAEACPSILVCFASSAT